MKVKGKDMKNRMQAYIAGIALFVAAMAVAPRSDCAILYNHNAWAFGLNDRVPPAIAFGPQLSPPVSGGRPIANTYSGGMVDIDSGTITLNGSIYNGTLVDTGARALTFSGANTYSGSTLVYGGMLSGIGTIQLVTPEAKLFLPVINFPGTLTFDGDLTLSACMTNLPDIFNGTLCDLVNGNGADLWMMNGGTVFDFNGFSGGVTNGFTLDLNNLFMNWAPINVDGLIYPVLGLPDDQQIDVLDGSLTIVSETESAPLEGPSFGGGVVLTVIPEPASAMMLLFGAGVGLVVHRARRGALRR